MNNEGAKLFGGWKNVFGSFRKVFCKLKIDD
jgi:hypothetical protein